MDRGDGIGIGIIGYGIMGERLLRAALGPGAASVRVCGVWDPSPAAMARLAEGFPEIARFDGVAPLIETCDCVYVAAPPASHLDHARAALAAGKALFCEKPLAVDVAQARAFVRDADAAGMRAAVNFPFASSPAVDRIEAWMADGTLGALREADIEVGFAAWPRPWQEDAAAWLDRRLQGGFTREVLSHFLFLAGRLLGPATLGPASVRYPVDGASERAVAAELTCGTLPVRVVGRVGETEKADTNAFTLHGENGTIRLRDWSIAERLVDGAWREAEGALPQEEARPITLARQLEKVAAMARGAPHGLAALSEALAVQELVEAILASGDEARG
ncbi:Gfo/Idh/MocA family protein [Salinarimonas chemoclinalis]|uniref:Gfo/Idh/MocA family protein n=1 Tax=Salinarimonas chemoclinalis TaxID=3241599 RepID=UPI003556E09E